MDQKSNKTIVWIVGTIAVVLLIGGIAYAVARSSYEKTPPTTSVPAATESTEETTTPEVAPANESATTINFTDNGFEKDTYTVKKGSTVTVMNQSSTSVQFSSDNHPSHTDQSELNMKMLQAGESGTFTVTKVGEWGFHDHIQDQYEGVLVVTE